MSLNEQINQVVNKAINEYIHRLSTEFNLPEDGLLSLWEKNASTPLPPPPSKKSKLVQTKLSTDDVAAATNHLTKMSKGELVELCKTKNYPISGTKEQLIERLSGKSEPVKPKAKASKTSKKTPEKPEVINRVIKQHVSNIGIKRNKYNRYEHMETKLLFDEATQKVYGKQNYQTGEIDRLSSEDIETCQLYKFPFVMPENLDQSNQNTTIDDDEEETVNDDVDDEIEVDVECELDDDDLEEDLDDIEAELEYEYE